MKIFTVVATCCYSMDSTKLTGDGLGRYVNDAVACETNTKMRVVEIDKRPHLALFATKNILPNEEICYDYGVPDLPWRTKVHFVVLIKCLSIYKLCKLYD